MSQKFGLVKTILRPNARSGTYAIFNDQMQRFFKRAGGLAKSGGSGPTSMVDLYGDSSDEVINRWGKQLLLDCLSLREIGPLLHLHDISGRYEHNDDFLKTELSEKEIRYRVKNIVWFMRKYCDDFIANFRKVAIRHTRRFNVDDYYGTYTVLFSNSSRDSPSFGTLYVDELTDVYYADAWNDVGYDEIAFRKPYGRPWTKSEKTKLTIMLEKELSSDSIVLGTNYDSEVYIVFSVKSES